MSDGYAALTTLGAVAVGETDTVFAPRTPRVGTCGLILLHGSGNPQQFTDSASQHASAQLAAAFASAGIPTIAGEFGGQTWGNDTVMSRIDTAWGVLQSAYPSMRVDKVCLLGVSMGAAAVARYSQTYPSKVAAVIGLIPLWDLVALYEANILGKQTEIGTAWGVTAPAALPSAADVAANAALAAGIPTLAGYSTADAVVAPSWVTDYVAAVGGTAVVTDTVYGHADQAIGGMPLATMGQFLAAHGA